MKKWLAGGMSLILALSLAACGIGGNTGSSKPSTGGETNEQTAPTSNSGVQQPVTLTWAAGGMGGGWYSMAGGIASMIKEKNPNINIKVIPGGALQNIPFIGNGEAEIAWEQPAFVQAGVRGEEPFKVATPDLAAIANGLGVSYLHFLVDAESDINTVDELFQKKNVKIALSPVNNSDEWLFRKIMEYYQTSYEDIKASGGAIFQGSYAEQAEQFKNHNVDAVFSWLGLPAASVTDATVSRKTKLLPMSDGLIEYLSQYQFTKAAIPAGTYPSAANGNEAINGVMMGNIIVVSKKVPDEVVYEITKAINDNIGRLPAIHGSLKDYVLEEATKNLGTDLHPGALKYYQEKGILQ